MPYADAGLVQVYVQQGKAGPPQFELDVAWKMELLKI